MNDPSIARQRETRTKVRRCRLEKELCASCRFSPRPDADDAHHPGVHMVEQMRSEEHTSELQSLMRISYAVFCLNKKRNRILHTIFMHYMTTKKYNSNKT